MPQTGDELTSLCRREVAAHLLDVHGQLVAFQSRWERKVKLQLNTLPVQLLPLLLVRIVCIDPFGMNDIVRHNMVLQDFGECLLPERRKEINDKIRGELLPCLIVGKERSDDRRADEVACFVLVVPVNVVLKSDFLKCRSLVVQVSPTMTP